MDKQRVVVGDGKGWLGLENRNGIEVQKERGLVSLSLIAQSGERPGIMVLKVDALTTT